MTALAADVAVVGAGLTGMALAYGLARRGARVVLLDARDRFGQLAPSVAPVLAQQALLAGVESAHLARLAVDSWTQFDTELADIAGCLTQYRRDGGLYLCSRAEDLEARSAALDSARSAASGASIETEILDDVALRRLVPHLDGAVAGASYCPDDARISPHGLGRSLALALARLGVDYRPHNRVQWVREQGGEWVVMAQGLAVGCGRVALVCGAGAATLAPEHAPASPRLRTRAASVLQLQALVPFLPFATAQFNQSGDGSIHLDTRGLGVCENDDADTVQARAAAYCTGFQRLRRVRTWHLDDTGLPGGKPCYQPLDAAQACWLVAAPDPLLFAPVHSGIVADTVAGRMSTRALAAFHGESDTDAACAISAEVPGATVHDATSPLAPARRRFGGQRDAGSLE